MCASFVKMMESKDFNVDLIAPMLDMTKICTTHNLPREFIIEFAKHLQWGFIVQTQKIDEDLLRELWPIWNDIRCDAFFKNKRLSETYLREFHAAGIADEQDWCNISRYQKRLSEEFIREHIQLMNLNDVFCRQKNISEEFIAEYWTKETITIILERSTKISRMDILEDMFECMDAEEVTIMCETQDLSEQFMRTHFQQLNHSTICRQQNLSESFIEEYLTRLPLNLIINCQKLSEQFIRRHFNSWGQELLETLCLTQTLSQKFIDDYEDRLPLEYLAKTQCLSEAFIQKHFDQVKAYMGWISNHSILSEKFMDEYFDLLDIHNIIASQQISMDFVRRHPIMSSDELYATSLLEHYYLPDDILADIIEILPEDEVGMEEFIYTQNLSIQLIRRFKHKLKPCKPINAIIQRAHKVETLALELPSEIATMIGAFL